MHRWDDNFRSKRHRGEYSPRSDGTIVRAEWRTSSEIVEKLAFDAIHFAFNPTGPIARGESPTVFAIADKFQGVADGIFLLHKCRLPAILEVVAVVSAHEFVTNIAKVDPKMRELMCEERAGIKELAIVNFLPLIGRAKGAIALRRQRVGWRTKPENVQQQTLVVTFVAMVDESRF